MSGCAMILAFGLLLVLLAGCGEPASSWSDKQGRFRPTDEVKREIINEEIDKRRSNDCN